MKTEPTVFVVDDDEAVRDSLRWLIQSVGLDVALFGSAQEFLDAYDASVPGCLVLDVRMPGLSGLDLQERLNQEQINIPVIIVTGHGDVPMAVRAMKAGAAEFIEKPFSDQVLLDQIQAAIARDRTARKAQSDKAYIGERISRLTAREHEVMDLVVAGHSSRQIAARLGVNPKTIEAHRSHIMEKMEADGVAHLVKLVLTATQRQQSAEGNSGNFPE